MTQRVRVPTGLPQDPGVVQGEEAVGYKPKDGAVAQGSAGCEPKDGNLCEKYGLRIFDLSNIHCVCEWSHRS
jgi:hypothetical protein